MHPLALFQCQDNLSSNLNGHPVLYLCNIIFSPGVPDITEAGPVVPAAGQAGRRGGPLGRAQDLDLRD